MQTWYWQPSPWQEFMWTSTVVAIQVIVVVACIGLVREYIRGRR